MTRRVSGKISLILLLGMLLGNAGVLVHAVVHEGGDSIECQLCSSFGQSVPVVARADAPQARTVVVRRIAAWLPSIPRAHVAIPPGQRGPPTRT